MDCLASINWNKVTPCLVLLVLELVLKFSECASQADVNKHLELGRDFLARGQLSDALTHYHAAVEGDPNNYLTYFKRGTVYYALGKAKFALQDFSKVLELKSDFTSAQLQRANVYLKLAQYNDAQKDYLQVSISEPHNSEAAQALSSLEDLADRLRLAEAYYRGGEYRAAADLATSLLELSPWSAHIRQLRAECYIATNDLISAVSDIRSVSRLQQDSTAGYRRLASLLYQLGHVADALKEVRECLRLDPEHKECFPLYKRLRKLDKLLLTCEEAVASRQHADCAAAARRLLQVEEDAGGVRGEGERGEGEEGSLLVQYEGRRWLCTCTLQMEEYAEALSQCNLALEIERSGAVLCDKAEALLGLEMYEEATTVYKQALETEPGLARARDGLQRAQAMQRGAERRDYYKILGVKRSATKREIVKAYRKAAQKWHPDSYHGDEKKIAEKKFIDIAAAKEVLTDPQKRAQFDAGADPLDPETQREPFASNNFHHFQHGSPFQFKFHFN